MSSCTHSRTARLFLHERESLGEYYARWRGQWYVRHQDSVTYEATSEEDMAAVLDPFLTAYDREKTITRKRKAETLDKLKSLCKVSDKAEPPCWFSTSERAPEPRESLIVFKNGVLDVEKLLSGVEGSFTEHTPGRFLLNTLPTVYQPGAQCPKTIDFVTTMFDGDAERVHFVQEHLGWCLLPDTSHDVIVGYFGNRAGNGKSTLMYLYHGAIGTENISAVPLDNFGQRFGLANTIGKLLNIAPELETLTPKDISRLKSWTSDHVEVEKKHRDSDMVKPTARLVFTSNQLPAFQRDKGLERRLVIIPCDHSFLGAGEIPKYHEVLLREELPGICMWALEGLKRLRQRGDFIKPAASQAALTGHVLANDPISTFLSDYTTVKTGAAIATRELYEAFKQWYVGDYPGTRPPAQPQFAVGVKTFYTGIKPRRIRFPGAQVMCYPDIVMTQAQTTEEWADVTLGGNPH